ncbi:unnamed protein product [Calicophoron daubneyi]|uniref:Uncharacterized protein n=1 Tax=Calicophoron daubneyi TaxID=300641 RepID=A0AAV2TGY6_CALDB
MDKSTCQQRCAPKINCSAGRITENHCRKKRSNELTNSHGPSEVWPASDNSDMRIKDSENWNFEVISAKSNEGLETSVQSNSPSLPWRDTSSNPLGNDTTLSPEEKPKLMTSPDETSEFLPQSYDRKPRCSEFRACKLSGTQKDYSLHKQEPDYAHHTHYHFHFHSHHLHSHHSSASTGQFERGLARLRLEEKGAAGRSYPGTNNRYPREWDDETRLREERLHHQQHHHFYHFYHHRHHNHHHIHGFHSGLPNPIITDGSVVPDLIPASSSASKDNDMMRENISQQMTIHLVDPSCEEQHPPNRELEEAWHKLRLRILAWLDATQEQSTSHFVKDSCVPDLEVTERIC